MQSTSHKTPESTALKQGKIARSTVGDQWSGHPQDKSWQFTSNGTLMDASGLGEEYIYINHQGLLRPGTTASPSNLPSHRHQGQRCPTRTDRSLTTKTKPTTDRVNDILLREHRLVGGRDRDDRPSPIVSSPRPVQTTLPPYGSR